MNEQDKPVCYPSEFEVLVLLAVVHNKKIDSLLLFEEYFCGTYHAEFAQAITSLRDKEIITVSYCNSDPFPVLEFPYVGSSDWEICYHIKVLAILPKLKIKENSSWQDFNVEAYVEQVLAAYGRRIKEAQGISAFE